MNMGETEIYLQKVFILAGKHVTLCLLDKFHESKEINLGVIKTRAKTFYPGGSIRPEISNSGTRGYKSIKNREFVH